MGVWSLLQYFEHYAPQAIRRQAVHGSDALEPFDVVYVDANSVLFGADITRVLQTMQLLRPRCAFILAADEADAGKEGRPKPGKYLSACRYFIATAEFIRGKKHETETALTDQEDYVSPLLLPQAVPHPPLRDAVMRTSKDCMLCAVARDVKGPADVKVAAAVRSCTKAAASGARHCVVSKDNDLLLTAMAAWDPSPDEPAATNAKAAAAKRVATPPFVLTWPGKEWEEDGVVLVDTGLALRAIVKDKAAEPAELARVGRDFAALVFLCLGGDFCPGLLSGGGGHFTHLHSLVERHVKLSGGTGLVDVSDDGADGTASVAIDADALLRLLKRSGVTRTAGEMELHQEPAAPPQHAGEKRKLEHDDDGGGESPMEGAAQWCVSFWASLAAVAVGRTVRKDESFGRQFHDGLHTVTPGVVAAFIEGRPAEAAAALRGEFRGWKKPRNSAAPATAEPLVVEVYSSDPTDKNLQAAGEALPAAKLPPRSAITQALPPLLSHKIPLYRARLGLREALGARLRALKKRPLTPKLAAAGHPSPDSRPPGSPALALFKGFGRRLAGGKTAKPQAPHKAVSVIETASAAAVAAEEAPPPALSMQQRIWQSMGVEQQQQPQQEQAGGSAGEEDRSVLAAYDAQKREKRKFRRAKVEQRRKEGGDEKPATAKQKLKAAAVESVAVRKAARKAKANAVAKRKLRKKTVEKKRKPKKKGGGGGGGGPD
ncbi:hypothetical protein DIPPA_20378 [Diplonema papillatum]|nr:hypothetical protein DIPPA_20378 [Diplonema papillatum]